MDIPAPENNSYGMMRIYIYIDSAADALHKNESVIWSLPRRLQNYTTGKPAKSSTKEHNPAVEPPVTKAKLSELDVNKIVNNPKLRHDINFDPDLHFRPNLDGEKKRKIQRAEDFWETMRVQLQEYRLHPAQFERGLGDTGWCLPATLKAIQGILETLVPQRDRAAVEETFNIELLMQQFQKGAEKLAAWLSQLLKCHCAPMRDSWVDEMVTQLGNGDRNGDVTLLVAGMQNLLGVLEAMKLVSFSEKTLTLLILTYVGRMWPIIKSVVYDHF
jgi:hypothetical protein